MAVIAAGVPAFVSGGDDAVAVELSVDGDARTVTTHAGTVREVLEDAGITVGEHDSVVPALDRAVADGQRVAVRFGREIHLDVDGTTRHVWVTATSVEEALAEVGLRDPGVRLSASRSAPIGREGLALRISTTRDVTVVADGKRHKLRTVATTVRALLAEAGISLDPRDEVDPTLSAVPADGAVIRVVRVEARRLTVRVDVPYRVLRLPDRRMAKGSERVTVRGRTGVKQVTYELLTRDGRRAGRDAVAQKLLHRPVTKVVRYGTGPARATTFARTGAEHLNWRALARCESGGNPRAVSPYGYYGLYQFSAGTWRSVGGSGLPHHASPAEQTYRAQLLYKRSGSGQWPNCGRRLFG